MAGDISLPIDLTRLTLPCSPVGPGRRRDPLPLKQLNQQRLAAARVGAFCLNGFMKN